MELKNARQALGLTQTEVAKVAGVSQQYITLLENGYRPARKSDALARVVAALGITLSP